jgi:GDP-L-fucose synthase
MASRFSLSHATTKPEGQRRRCLDVTRAECECGFRARIGFDDGLLETIEKYRNNRR